MLLAWLYNQAFHSTLCLLFTFRFNHTFFWGGAKNFRIAPPLVAGLLTILMDLFFLGL